MIIGGVAGLRLTGRGDVGTGGGGDGVSARASVTRTLVRLGGGGMDRLGGGDGTSSVIEPVTRNTSDQPSTLLTPWHLPLLPGGGTGRGGISGDAGRSSSSTFNACKGVLGGGESGGDDGGVGLDRRLTGGGGMGRVMRGGAISFSSTSSLDVSFSISAVALRGDTSSASPCRLYCNCSSASRGAVPDAPKAPACGVETVPCSCSATTWAKLCSIDCSSENSGEGHVCPS